MKTYNILTIEELKKNIDNNSRLLGIDPGKKNIGIAICDENKMVATPLKIIKKDKFANLLKEMKILATFMRLYLHWLNHSLSINMN